MCKFETNFASSFSIAGRRIAQRQCTKWGPHVTAAWQFASVPAPTAAFVYTDSGLPTSPSDSNRYTERLPMFEVRDY
jgi:hypothetical protein